MIKKLIFQQSSRYLNNRGSVLLTTYMVITVMLILGAAFLILSTNESRSAVAQNKTAQALYVAEAGIERMMYDLRQDFLADPSSPSWLDGITIGATTFGPNTASFYTVYSAVQYPEGNYTSSYSTTSTNNYTVSLRNVAGTEDIWINSTGVVDGVSQTIELYVRMLDLSPWDNAIFGGAGSSGTMVNGNVNVYGSVHILGNGLGAGDNAIDLGGTAELVGNNYNVGMQGLHPDLKDRIPDLDTVIFNGETVESLNAELRVKNGVVSLGGSSTVGQADATGNSVKETVDGAYVSDGYGGTKGAANVHSDNGTSSSYDLGDAVTFPSLSDPYPDNPAQNYYEYFADNALVLTTELAAVTPGSSFLLGDCSTNCVEVDGSGNLEVQGLVYVESGNTVGFSGGDFEYTGSGTLLVTGDVSINATLLTPTKTDAISGDPIATFPHDASIAQNNIIGIMTPGDINIGGTSQEDLMGLFFAEGNISTAKQTDLIGTIVSNYFDITDQVPSIFQVPIAKEYLPPGMIAGEPVYLMSVVSWRKI